MVQLSSVLAVIVQKVRPRLSCFPSGVYREFTIISKGMDNSTSYPLIACCQMTSTANKDENRNICRKLIYNSIRCGAKVVFLPECFDYVACSQEEAVKMAEPLDGPTIKYYQDLCKEFDVWLSLGGFHRKGLTDDVNRIYNTHILLDNQGNIKATYDKMHLFSVDIKGGPTLRENEHTIPGNRISLPVESPVGKIGLQICYDLRFSEESSIQAQLGAEILTYPSAFTVATGLAHWEVLLRARAIENQCYVVAAAQTGQHNEKRKSYGHSMIVDPWGAVISQVSEGTGICLAEINLDYLKKVRCQLPVWEHRRYDVYSNPLSSLS